MTMGKMKRVVLYVSSRDYARLKAKLRKRGQSVSWWFRQKVAQFLGRDAK